MGQTNAGAFIRDYVLDFKVSPSRKSERVVDVVIVQCKVEEETLRRELQWEGRPRRKAMRRHAGRGVRVGWWRWRRCCGDNEPNQGTLGCGGSKVRRSVSCGGRRGNERFVIVGSDNEEVDGEVEGGPVEER